MATISFNKGNGRYKVMLTDEELNTLTIALALLNIQDMEVEMEEQGLSENDVCYNHIEMFSKFAKVTNLYPSKELNDEERKNIKKSVSEKLKSVN